MARNSAPGTLIHCEACGEDYSATYKRCPFCGEKPGRQPTAPIPPVEGDDYVFDGGDVFEDGEESEVPASPKGGKRLAQADAPGPINVPRLITFICSLIIIAAALVIVFAYIYPKIHDPSPEASDPGVSAGVTSQAPESADPAESDLVDVTDDPGSESSDAPDNTTPGSTEVTVTGLTLNNVDFTLTANESYTIIATVTPADWDGTVTWTSSNTSIATVSANGTVTNVNSGSSLRSVTITATAGDMTATATVYCRGGSGTSTASPSAEPSAEPSSGTLTLNRTDFTLTMGQTFTIKATGADSVTWSIGNTDVATISEDGLVTPVAAGQTTVTCTASDGQTATCIVRIKD